MLRPLGLASALALSLAACSGGAEGSESAASGSATTTDGGATAATETSTSTGTDAGTESDTDTGGPIDYDAPGPHPVGNQRFTLMSGERSLLVEVWYPADASAAAAAALGHPIADFVPAGPDRDAMDGWLASLSPAGQIGTRLQTSSAFGAAIAGGGPWPLVVFSHCHGCARFSAFTLAERLASHGFVVAAPDHQDNTLFDNTALLGEDFLVIRRQDLQAVLDALLGDAAEVPAGLHGQIDGGRIGAMGHSFGAATVGRILQDDPRVLAALPIAAPVENPLFPGTTVAAITRPMLMIRAMEDNSILVIGNNLIKSNFDAANPPVWRVDVADAGHWNFSDICGLTGDLEPGCGEGTRQTAPGEAFTYLDIDVARGLAGAYATAFFDLHLRGNADAAARLEVAEPAAWVTVERRE
ncbi:MAG: dienelactone hydrolase family protein [Nannocystaceae bacterium]